MKTNKLWNRRLTAILLAATMTVVMLPGCGSRAPDYTSGTPWLDSNIDGNVTPDTEVNLKDDFYLAVNKEEIMALTYEPGSMIGTAMDETEKLVEDNMMALITDESFTSREAEQLRAYYHALDDWETREPLAKELLRENLDMIGNMTTMKDYYDAVHVWWGTHSLAAWGLLTFGVDVALDDPTTYIGGINGPSLILEDAAEYEERTESGEIAYEVNKQIYEYGCEIMGFDREEADQEFDRMITFEAKIAEHTLTQEEMMGADAVAKLNNYITVDELVQMLGESYDLKAELEDNGYFPERLMNYMPDQIEFIAELLGDESNLEDIKNWMKVRCLIDSTGDLSREAMIHVKEIAQEIMGTEDIREYDRMLLSQVDQDLGTFMQQAYVERYASPEMKEQITELCKDVIAEYRLMLQEEDWLSQEMKDKAVEKLDAVTINAVYPDKWEDYSGLDVTGMNYYEALQEISKFELRKACSMLNHKVDPEIWLEDPLEANAFYNPLNNSITILLGILGEETYTTDMSREEIYGRIGAVIGHEISHAFDSTGRQFDKDGNMIDWWPEADSGAFEERVEKVRTFYDRIAVYGDKYLVGAKLDGEATADIAGLQCMLRLAEKEDSFDYDTMFRSYAALWCGKQTPYATEYRYIYDPHPPEYLRVNVTLQQFDEFLETYGIQEGDGMYLAPEDRIKVW